MHLCDQHHPSLLILLLNEYLGDQCINTNGSKQTKVHDDYICPYIITLFASGPSAQPMIGIDQNVCYPSNLSIRGTLP